MPTYAARIVETITTEKTARDLEEARKGLGEDNLNPYGTSYRSLLRAAYATLFPQHTNKMVLDSSMSPNDARCTNPSLG